MGSSRPAKRRWSSRSCQSLHSLPIRGLQNAAEAALDFVLALIDDVIGPEGRRFLPLIATLGLFIFASNLLGLVPGFTAPTDNVNTNLACALVVFFSYHWIGIRKMGVVGYFKHMVPPGLPPGLREFIFLLELVTYFFTRPVTLALRLFGNMFAGHLLILLCVLGGEYLLFHADGIGLKVAGVATFFGGFVMTVFEILVEFLQAYIFTLLAALYIAGSLADDH